MRGIPSTADMHRPILRIIADSGTHKIGKVVDSVAKQMGVTAEARAIRTKTGRLSFDAGVRRAVSNLRIAGLLENEGIGVFRITRAGMDIAARRPPRIGAQYLRDNCEPYRLYMEGRAKSRRSLRKGGAAGAPRKRHGMVAMIDVLGVKGSWREHGSGGAPGLHKRWNGLLRSTKRLLKDDKTLGKGATFSAFSDTMFITASGRDYANLLLSFSRAMWPVITHSIRENVPVRGCVSCGSYFRSRDNLLTGQAVDEAAAYYSLPQWIGISAAPSANIVLSGAMPPPPHRDSGIYRRHDIPLKASVEQNAWALDWPRQCDDYDEEGAMDEIAGQIDERMEGLTDIGAALKWRNTRKFCDAVLLPPKRTVDVG